MLIVKKPNANILKAVARELKRGAVIVYPTDTAYGLGCDATNVRAVARIFKIKGRDKSKALPLICADLKMAKKFFDLHAIPYTLYARKYWPGPLSIVVKAKKGIAKAALEHDTAAIRVPDSMIARALSKYLGRPLVATSANISYQPTCYSVKAYLHQLTVIARSVAAKSPSGRSAADRQSRRDRRVAPLLAMTNRPDLILDAGALPRRRPSTILKIDNEGKIEVLRKGPIKI